MLPADHQAQEDALQLRWSGSGPAAITLTSATPLDLSRESNGDVQLQLTLRRDGAVTAPLWLGVTCGEGCAARVDLQPTVAALPQGQWTVVGVPLKCFGSRGGDVARLQQVAGLESAGALQLSVSRVALGALNESQATVDCLEH